MSDKRFSWIQFYPRDWISDMDLRRCSLAARGLWLEIICLMTQGRDFGRLVDGAGVKPTVKQLAEDARISEDDCAALLSELRARNVFSEDSDGVIYSRRMVREYKVRQRNSANGSKGGSPLLKPDTRDQRLETIAGLTDSVKPPLNQPDTKQQNLSINPPTLEDCQNAARSIGMKPELVEACFHYYTAQGWTTSSGIALRNLHSVLAKWKANASNFEKPKSAKGDKAETPDWKRLELLEGMAKDFTARNPSPERWTQQQRTDIQKWRDEIGNLKRKMTQ